MHLLHVIHDLAKHPRELLTAGDEGHVEFVRSLVDVRAGLDMGTRNDNALTRPVHPFNATLMMRCENLKPLRPYLELTFPRRIPGQGPSLISVYIGLKLQVHSSDTDEKRPSKLGISGVHEWKPTDQILTLWSP